MLLRALSRLPELQGEPIELRFLPELTVSRGKLLSGAGTGRAVHAGSFLRTRRMTLESALLENQSELARIIVHELLHFVWLRMNNASRRGYAHLLEQEFRRRARGECAWSAEMLKRQLPGPDDSRTWRLYVCESFCDSGAAYAARLTGHDEFTLAMTFWKRREAWFESFFGAGPRPV